ncbi:VOC family protein [Xenorhabdus bovienii]|uniref:VOC domain-containing protein n=1 Tax=Xenorhabdus bovienii (strain SS-2004) TaxID=406818 RepID=D3V116_XENBS|nr:VOC family protein [Xenorhabdus bovienii]MDE1473909.1 VOC family protein [Xenorhabdus bovienii]MDE9430031.1 VOC family protein [Xenorhabdus bovienii]MDE9460985.1 VOC family protein [Xenorhabdus bovienii]MDE9464891.1 VOC family protein [Xenorhabdus bovienii]MDE9468278.1 VOC family protein [Xenorhabdus bovienii]
MLDIVEFGHINIVVDDIDDATRFYQSLFRFELVQSFPHFQNSGFAKGAGFLEGSEQVVVAINFLKIPNTTVYLEIISYINPKPINPPQTFLPNELGGPRHIALRVRDIASAYEKIKSFPGVSLINPNSDYKPFQLDPVCPDDFTFANAELESDLDLKLKSSTISSSISFVYFTDKFGVMWELEEEPTGADDPALSV